MQIRESVENDKDAIRIVHLAAFGESEGETVSQLAIELLEDKNAQPTLSLVAEQNNEIIGNIIFSPVNIEGIKGISAYILAPLAVKIDNQRKGIGTKLINQGIETLRNRGADIVLVYGDPNYYTRTGFKAGHNLEAPYKLEYPEAWMAQELVEGVLTKTQGMVRCALPLNSPELW
jgi:predicted N-acetyltransferase YhbS